MNKRVVVTGSTGMLGSHLVAELLRRGYADVVLPVRSRARLAALAATLRREGFEDLADQVMQDGAKELHPVEVALNDPLGLKEAFAGADVVFHCAAAVSMSDDDPAGLIESNVEITTHVVDAAIACGVRRLVHASSVAALGEAPEGQKFIDEHTELENMAGTSPYGVSKFLSENRAWRGRTEGLQVVVVNPGIILGAGDWTSGGSTLIIPFAASGMPFYTDGVMGYVDVRDVARAEAELSECDKADGERFILVGENLTYKELISRVAVLAGKRPPKFRAGKGLLGLLWRTESLLSKVSRYKVKMTRSAAQAASRACYYNGNKIKGFLPDFRYTPIGFTIDRVLKAYNDDHRDK